MLPLYYYYATTEKNYREPWRRGGKIGQPSVEKNLFHSVRGKSVRTALCFLDTPPDCQLGGVAGGIWVGRGGRTGQAWLAGWEDSWRAGRVCWVALVLLL